MLNGICGLVLEDLTFGAELWFKIWDLFYRFKSWGVKIWYLWVLRFNLRFAHHWCVNCGSKCWNLKGISGSDIEHICHDCHSSMAWLSVRTHLTSQINDLLKRCYKCWYCPKINTLESADHKLFRTLLNHQHCILRSILPPTKPPYHDRRPKGHNYHIPNYSTNDLSFLTLYSSITDFSSLMCLFLCVFLL